MQKGGVLSTFTFGICCNKTDKLDANVVQISLGCTQGVAIEAQLLNRFADYGTKLNGTDVESNIEHTNHRAELADKYQIGNAGF